MIKTVDIKSETYENSIILLGFFDCLHIGHAYLIEEAKKLRNEKGGKIAMLTFKDGFYSALGKDFGSVLNFTERVEKAERLGVEEIIGVDFDEEFKKLSPEEFCEILFGNHKIIGAVCGYDYTYGNGGTGNAETLKRYCSANGIALTVVPKREVFAGKISTSLIKEYLSEGNLAAANILLGEPYFVVGRVVEGRKIGREMGFPTANVLLPSGKMPIKYGVYETHAELDGKTYKGITNYGARPTFSLEDLVIETHFDGFNGDLYGKEICLYFDAFLRPIQKFSSVNQLIERLTKDLESIK